MITKEAIKRGLKASDIVNEVKQTPTSRISKTTKAEIILDKLDDKSYREIARERNLAKNTPLKVIKDNKELIRQIETKQTELKESVRDKYLRLLDRKSNLLGDEKKLDRSKSTELSQVVKDLDTLIRLDKGEATIISQHEAKTTEQLQLESVELLEAIKDNDKLKLLRLVFNK